MENLLQIPTKAGPFQRFCEEVTLQGLVLKMVAYVGESLLPVHKGVDHR